MKRCCIDSCHDIRAATEAFERELAKMPDDRLRSGAVALFHIELLYFLGVMETRRLKRTILHRFLACVGWEDR